ncbi:hypothetical protein BDV06DRAFT_189594 [Aspergillus oleicola]
MPKRGSHSFLRGQKYPSAVPDLSEASLKVLIGVLATDPPLDAFPYYEQYTNDKIQQAIRNLPPALCRKSSILSLSKAKIPAANLCTAYKRLNPYIISHIFRLIK